MPEIKVLPKQVSELIAAGEVVERPSSVIKELVENSIDAGATIITVEIKNGGVTYMRVTDNGCGIARGDVATAFLRHATSKVRNENDLEEIATLGFRGEALAAISSVSRVEMLTKQKVDEVGTLYTSNADGNVNVSDAGCPDGTTIIIRDLFFNTPARMKFLKKDVAEGNSVGAVMDHIALSHPEISFRFIREGKSVFVTTGDGKLMSAIYSVLGREFSNTLIPVEGELGGIKVSGYTCLPSACRQKRNAQFVFLNGRYVRSGTVSSALEAAYKNLAMVGRYPAAVLHITVPYGAVDINVHPAKTEVRFSDERRIFDCVMYSVKNAIAKGDVRPVIKLPTKSGQIRMTADEYRQTVIPEIEKNSSNPLKSYADLLSKTAKNDNRAFHSPTVKPGLVFEVPSVAKDTTNTENQQTVKEENPVNITSQKNEVSTEKFVPNDFKTESKVFEEDKTIIDIKPEAEVKQASYEVQEKITYIGEAFSTYIMVEKGESIFIIDKHAAHERILFNRLKASVKNDPQLLLSPEQVVLRQDDYTAISENLELLEKAGFEIDDFGDNTVLVRSIPSILSGENIGALIMEIADSLLNKKTVEVERLERIYETMSCRAAIKGGNLSSKEELSALAEAVLSNKDIMYCPHGRPVAYELKKREIEKQFGRIQ